MLLRLVHWRMHSVLLNRTMAEASVTAVLCNVPWVLCQSSAVPRECPTRKMPLCGPQPVCASRMHTALHLPPSPAPCAHLLLANGKWLGATDPACILFNASVPDNTAACGDHTEARFTLVPFVVGSRMQAKMQSQKGVGHRASTRSQRTRPFQGARPSAGAQRPTLVASATPAGQYTSDSSFSEQECIPRRFGASLCRPVFHVIWYA